MKSFKQFLKEKYAEDMLELAFAERLYTDLVGKVLKYENKPRKLFLTSGKFFKKYLPVIPIAGKWKGKPFVIYFIFEKYQCGNTAMFRKGLKDDKYIFIGLPELRGNFRQVDLCTISKETLKNDWKLVINGILSRGSFRKKLKSIMIHELTHFIKDLTYGEFRDAKNYNSKDVKVYHNHIEEIDAFYQSMLNDFLSAYPGGKLKKWLKYENFKEDILIYNEGWKFYNDKTKKMLDLRLRDFWKNFMDRDFGEETKEQQKERILDHFYEVVLPEIDTFNNAIPRRFDYWYDFMMVNYKKDFAFEFDTARRVLKDVAKKEYDIRQKYSIEKLLVKRKKAALMFGRSKGTDNFGQEWKSLDEAFVGWYEENNGKL